MINDNDIKKAIDDQWEVHKEHFEYSVTQAVKDTEVRRIFKECIEEDASLDAFLNELQPKGWDDDVLVCVYELLSNE